MIIPLMRSWDLQESKLPAVLCSVVIWKGSVPRKDYPLMLVLADGSILGTIGGGSMELNVTRAALKLMDQKQADYLEFDMTGSDVQGDQGLCGGTLGVLVEPFTGELETFYRDLCGKLLATPKCMVQIEISLTPTVQVRRKNIMSRRDITHGDLKVADDLKEAFESQRTTVIHGQGEQMLLWKAFSPPRLHLFGAGHVGQAVAELAGMNELDVIVYDDRKELMTSSRFPNADMIQLNFPVVWDSVPSIAPDDYILIASREHRQDRDLLAGLLKVHREYIGLVSSSRKWQLLRASLESSGIPASRLDQVHAPVGLNIDAQTVPEIAISIMAEIIATYRSQHL